MKPLHILPLLFALFLITACEKEPDTVNPPTTEKPEPEEPQPNLPCLGYFECDINGEPFETWGGPSCLSSSTSYDSTYKKLFVVGHDCRVDRDDFSAIVFTLFNVNDTGTFPITQANGGYADHVGRPVAYNIELAGEAKITGLIKSNYSEDWSRGYVEGTFWMTLYSEERNDTIYITNGRFCGRL